MKTAADTNIFVDILIGNPRADLSRGLLRQARAEGTTVICPLVYTELAALLTNARELDVFIQAVGVKVESFSKQTLQLAGEAWHTYTERRPKKLVCPGCGTQTEITCPACGRTIGVRQHILTDFLVGAHATVQTERLLSHDRDFIRRYFPTLVCLP